MKTLKSAQRRFRWWGFAEHMIQAAGYMLCGYSFGPASWTWWLAGMAIVCASIPCALMKYAAQVDVDLLVSHAKWEQRR